jgi:integrase
MARRGHGEGSIYQRKDGRWAASISLEGGKRKTFYGKTRKDVQEQLKTALYEQQHGKLATGPKQTVEQYFNRWLEEVHKPTIRISTYTKYRNLLDKHILPAIGNVQLNKLTLQKIQALYMLKLQEGYKPSTVHAIHEVIHRGLDQAIRWKYITENISEYASLPRVGKQENQTLTTEQAQKLLEAAKDHLLETLLTVALATGMRRGELLGLRWQDINFETMSLQVCRTVGFGKGRNYTVNEPKTASGRRRIILPQFAIDALKQHRIQQLERRLQVGSEWIDRDLVFSDSVGNYFPLSSLEYMFQVLLKKAELPHMRFHDLRHSAATILLTMGVHPKVVQELLGHSQISMTMDTYSHVLPSMQQEAMNKLDDAFRQRS